MVNALGVKVLRTPVRAPKANAFCERIVRTVRRECLDFLIPFSEAHLRHILHEWMEYYNHGRPHKCLGPGIPEPLVPIRVPLPDRHVIPSGQCVRDRRYLEFCTTNTHLKHVLHKLGWAFCGLQPCPQGSIGRSQFRPFHGALQNAELVP